MALRSYKYWILIVWFLTATDVAGGQSSKSSDSPSVSPNTYKQLKATETHLDKSEYRKALGIFKQLLPKVKEKAFEKAVVLRSMASVYAMLDQYRKAAEAMKQSLDTKALPEDQKQQALINLAQIYIKLERYRLAAEIMEPWIKTAEKVSADDYILIAHVFTQLKRYRKALPYVKKAIASTKYPKEPWYQLMLALHYELKDLPATASVLKDLIQRFPNKEYWEQLASVYQQMDQNKKAASIKELAYQSGYFTTPKEILDLVNLFLFVDAPYKGARLLEKQLDQGVVPKTSKNFELLANAWTQAQEFKKASIALKNAARLSNSGELYVRLGRIYIEEENWSEARNSILKGLKQGNVKDSGNAYILLGLANYELKLHQQAKNAFRKAKKYKKVKKTAQQWLNYIQPEA